MTFAVVIVSFSPTAMLRSIVDQLFLQQIPAESIAIIASGGPRSLVEIKTILEPHNINIIASTGPLDIMSARLLACESLESEFLVFLDDDCLPLHSWRVSVENGINRFPTVSMMFGPRIAVPRGLGARVRAVEAVTSSKLKLSSGDAAFLPNPRALVAGGNMLVNRNHYLSLAHNQQSFYNLAFEDVDMQMCFLEDNRLVVYSRDMSVKHFDNLTFSELIRKSLKSGRGMRRCQVLHSHTFSTVSKWRVWKSRWYQLIALIGLLSLRRTRSRPVLRDDLLVMTMLLVLTHGAEVLPSILRPVRDGLYLVGYLCELFKDWGAKRK